MGVHPNSILNTLKKPQNIKVQNDGVLRIKGEQGTVVINKDGRIITTWAHNSKFTRKG